MLSAGLFVILKELEMVEGMERTDKMERCLLKLLLQNSNLEYRHMKPDIGVYCYLV